MAQTVFDIQMTTEREYYALQKQHIRENFE